MLTERQQALVVEHLPMVRCIVKELMSKANVRRLGWDDAFQAGCVGMVVAASAFDESLGYKFSTYSNTAVRNGILFAARHLSVVDVSDDLMRRAYRGDADWATVPLTFTTNGFKSRAMVEEPDGVEWTYYLEGLQRRERSVLTMAFVEGLTMEKIGSRLGVTRQRAYQIRQSALEHVRRRIE